MGSAVCSETACCCTAAGYEKLDFMGLSSTPLGALLKGCVPDFLFHFSFSFLVTDMVFKFLCALCFLLWRRCWAVFAPLLSIS